MIYTRCMKRGSSRTSHSNGSLHQRLSVEVTESYKHVPGSPDSAPVAPLEAAGLCNIQHGGKRERGEKNGNRQLSEPIVVKTSPFCTALGDLTLRAGLQPVQGRGGRGSSGCLLLSPHGKVSPPYNLLKGSREGSKAKPWPSKKRAVTRACQAWAVMQKLSAHHPF